MARRFEATYGPQFEARRKSGDFGATDPMIAVMVAARWFFYFFTVEKCFGAPLHFGMTPTQAVDEFIRLLRFGLLPRGGAAPTHQESNERKTKTLARARTTKRSRPTRGSKS
jgi:hypothetical protein